MARRSFPPSAVTAALDAEIESYLGVDRAHSVLRDHHGRMLLLVKVGLDGRVGVAEIRAAVEPAPSRTPARRSTSPTSKLGSS